MTLIEFIDKHGEGLAVFTMLVLLFFILPAIGIIAAAISNSKRPD